MQKILITLTLTLSLVLTLTPSISLGEEIKKPKTPFQKRMEERQIKKKSEIEIGSSLPKRTYVAENIVKGIIYCIAIFLLFSHLNNYLKSKKETKTENDIDILARRGIGNRMSLLLVKVEEKKFFLSQTQDSITMLAPLSDPLEFSENFDEIQIKEEEIPST